MSARKLSQGTNRSMASSGSPFADSAANLLSASKKTELTHPRLPNHAIAHETRTAQSEWLFFEVP